MYRSQQQTMDGVQPQDDATPSAPVHGLIYVWTFSLMIWAAIGAVLLLR